MSLQPRPTLSLKDLLEGERAALGRRSECVDGKVFAMTGASRSYNANIGRELSTQLKGCSCQVYATNMKVLIRSANAVKYPDLVAYCGEPQSPPRPTTAATNSPPSARSRACASI